MTSESEREVFYLPIADDESVSAHEEQQPNVDDDDDDDDDESQTFTRSVFIVSYCIEAFLLVHILQCN